MASNPFDSPSGERAASSYTAFVNVEGVTVTCCEYQDARGDGCGFPGTIQSGGPKWLCLPHHRLITGSITPKDCADWIRRRRVGLTRPVRMDFEAHHCTELDKRDAKGIPARTTPPLPYNPGERADREGRIAE